ncbi:MAG: hypothetical protein AAGE76_00630 [Pseudomonadota bacterium]
MGRIVISTQRSGLNWVRYVIEAQTGLRTPGKTVLIDAKDQPNEVFTRSHDPLQRSVRTHWWARRPGPALKAIDPAHTGGDTVVLLVRDYREVFVRACRKSYRRYAAYLGNLEFYDLAATRRKAVFHYEDIVKDPAAMAGLIAFLGLEGREGSVRAADLARDWDRMGQASRGIYDKNQRAAGGAQTRREPFNFRFHQANLSAEDLRRLKDTTRAAVAPGSLEILWRYFED